MLVPENAPAGITEDMVSALARDRSGLVHASTADRVIFPLRKADGKTQDYILTLEPLARPGGFTLVRGREYRELLKVAQPDF